MRAHRSNFQILGFTSEPTLEEMVTLSHRSDVSIFDDLGSGALLDTSRFGLGHEPMIQESLAAGVDLLCFSGDKLLGGPQAGIILGKSEFIEKLKKHPLARAIRADKLCLAALSATLLHYVKDEALVAIPVWRMITCTADAIRSRADHWVTMVQMGDVIPGQSTIGGGSLPGETLPTWLLAIPIQNPDRILARLRQTNPPIIARIEADQIVFDPRTILPEQEFIFLDNLRAILELR
jgi:L-seryl-tRNA(Ser) seleniumtransferase